ncbi:DUF624 domain-containing protein [Streptococcus oricebi]|uniref:DUF624 domain-containing protein n=1 Tax=Streptococcus oricebi TaxID=1547447 RepID=A0ABS5B5W7_9STRE|nr:DUF624 domain-containing protein [Streptococcus oricebi]MBP2624220.1 hypothetical protein [Streptococcus oricebi]
MRNRGAQLIKSVFNTDNFLMRIAEKIFDLASLNLLFLLSCLPLVTIGIAKMSLYQSLFAIKKGRRVSVLKTYLGALRKNWKRGLQVGSLELLVVFLCLLNLLLFRKIEDLPFQLIKVLSIAVLVFMTILFLYAYPLAARYQMSFQGLAQASMLMASLHFLGSFAMVGLLGVILFLASWSVLSFLLLSLLFFLIGFAGLAFLQLKFLEPILEKYGQE